MAKRSCNTMGFRAAFFVILAFGCYSSAVWAYQFFQVSDGGAFRATRWRTLPVNFLVDNGPTDILAEVQDAIDTWNNIPTAQDVFGTLTRATNPGGAARDFTGANFTTAWGNLNDNQHEVVLDEDGTAFAALGLNAAEVNGFGPTRRILNGSGQGEITGAFNLLNGTRADFDRRSTTVHEFGHIQGLAHSAVGMHNSLAVPSDALDPINIAAVPTMHPFSSGTGQNRRTPEPDDIAALSELYPGANFAASFGTITGRVTRCLTEPPEPLLGVNVRAVNVADPNIQISRYTGFNGNAEGRYSISVPPGTYRVLIEVMGANGFIAGRMAIVTRVDSGFPTEYYNPPAENDCTDDPPDTPENVEVSAGSSTMVNFQVAPVRLALVVDDTGSMGQEIDGVRQILTGFITELEARLGAEAFPTTAVITFKDNVTLRLVSANPDRLREIVGGLTASGGGDCPESSNAALLTAGRLLSDRGVALLFTDADSRPDGPTVAAVTTLYRSKSLRLSVLLSDACSGITTSSLAPSTFPVLQAERLAPQRMTALPQSPLTTLLACSAPALTPGGALDEFPPEPVLGEGIDALESSVELAAETDGTFAAITEINTGTEEGTTRYINTGLNLALSSLLPAVSLATPPQGARRTTLDVEIRGATTNFQGNSTVVFAGDGIVVNEVMPSSPTRIIANITIAAGAPLGFRDVTVRTDLGGGVIEEAIGIGAFLVEEALTVPTLLSVIPASGTPGATLDLTVRGANTSFAESTSVADFGTGVTVNTTTVLNPTTAMVNVTLAPDAPIGYRDVRVTTGAEVATGDLRLFLVAPEAAAIPRLVMVEPNEARPGQTLDVALTGENTDFVDGVSAATFSGTGITVNSTQVTSPTTAVANVTLAADALPGFRDVSVMTGDEIATLLNGFNVRVTAPTPVLVSVTPNTGARRQTLDLQIVGMDTNFVDGTSVAAISGAGITVNRVQVTSPTTATVNITIAADAPLGVRDVSITTGAETVTLPDGFTVAPVLFRAVLAASSPRNPLTVAGMAQNVRIFQLQLTAGAEEVRVTRLQINLQGQTGEAAAVERLRFRLINDTNGNGQAEAREPVLVTQAVDSVVARIRFNLPAGALVIPANTTANLLVLLDVNVDVAAANLTRPFWSRVGRQLAWFGVVVPLFGLLWLPRQRQDMSWFSVGLMVLVLCLSMALAGCPDDDDDGRDEQLTFTFTPTIPTDGITGVGAASGPVSSPAQPLAGPAVTVERTPR